MFAFDYPNEKEGKRDLERKLAENENKEKMKDRRKQEKER